MKARVDWHGELTFTGTADTGFTVPLGADARVGGADDGFRPLELMALSLAGCTAMDVVSILRKKRQNVTAFDVAVETEQAEEHPRVFTGAVVRYEVTGRGIEERALLRAMQLSAETYCPAQAMMARLMPIRLEYAIWEGDSEEDRVPVGQGVWEPDPAEEEGDSALARRGAGSPS